MLFITAPKRGSFCYSKAWQKSRPWLDVRGVFRNFKLPWSCFEDTVRGWWCYTDHNDDTSAEEHAIFSAALMWNVSAVVPSREEYLGDARFLFQRMRKSYAGHFLNSCSRCPSLISGFGAVYCKLQSIICSVTLPLRIQWPTSIARDFEVSRNTQTNHEPSL